MTYRGQTSPNVGTPGGTAYSSTIGGNVNNATALMSGGGIVVSEVTSLAADAANNAALIQAALTAAGSLPNGGFVDIPYSGTIFINKTLLQPSNVYIRRPFGAEFKLAASANCNIMRNKSAGVTLPAASFVRASNVVTVTEAGHPRVVGDSVHIANLATDTSFNGLVVITAVTASTWTYASTGTNGSPTGNGWVTPAFNQLPASSFVRASNVVTVSEPGHTRDVGDAVFVGNLATDTSFNGPVTVTGVTASTWTYASTGSNGSPTGIGVVAGDNNLGQIGGANNGNYLAQSGSAPYTSNSACFGTVYGNVGKPTIRDLTIRDQIKYGVWLFNANGADIDGIVLDGTPSDGIHFEGPADNGRIGTITGSSADDMLAFTNTSANNGGSYLGFASPSGLGNFGTFTVRGLYPAQSSAPAILKICGYSSTSFGSLTVDNIVGSLSTASNVAVAIVDDTASTTGMAIGEIIVRHMLITGGSTTNQWFNVTATGNIQKLRVENPYLTAAWNGLYMMNVQAAAVNVKKLEVIGYKNDYTMTTGQQGLLIAGTIAELLIDGFEHQSAATNTPLVSISGTVTSLKQANGIARGLTKGGYNVIAAGTVTTAMFDNVECNGNDSVFRNTAGTLGNIFLNNVRMVGTANGVVPGTSCTIYANNFVADSNLGNRLFQVNGGTVRINAKNCQSPGATKSILFNTGGSVISFTNSDASLPIDMGNPAVTTTGETPQTGDWHYNSNATTGGMYCYSQAGAWVKVA